MAARKCGLCAEPGHTRRTCKNVADTTQSFDVGEVPADPFTDPTPAARPRPVFPAAFDQECTICDGAIFEGDDVRMGVDGAECASHLTDDEPEWSFTPPADHVHAFEWADDGNGHSGSFCACGQQDTAALKLERHQAAQAGPECGQGTLLVPDPVLARQLASAAQEATGPFPVIMDVFSDPTPPSVPVLGTAGNETGNRGYFVKDPRTGEFNRFKNGNIKPFTRMTTLIKAGSDRTALTDWNMRNVLLGAAHRPDLMPRVLELHPHPQGPLPEDKETKEILDDLVDQVSQHVGSKRAADEGTAVHASIERVARDGAPMDTIPEHHVPWVRAFLKCLEENDLELIPSLVEKTVFLPQFGGIVGRFDQAVRCLRTGRVLMTDNKTGRIDYAWHEIQGQLAGYVAGYMQHGTYAWPASDPEEGRWEPPQFSMDAKEAIVFHLPVKSGNPSCTAERVNLVEGWAHLEECGRMREHLRYKPKPVAYVPPPVTVGHVHYDATGVEWEHPGAFEDCSAPECQPAPEPEDRDWVAEFANASSKAHLAGLYESARSVFGEGEKLNYLVATGTARLSALAALAVADTILAEHGAEPPF